MADPPPLSRSSASFEALPLRARKAAQTRLALMDAVVARLATGPLDAVSLRACCAEVGVSDPTFFNYFGEKAGALVFFVALWSVEQQWHLARAPSARAGLQGLFDRTAESVRRAPFLMPEIITHQLRIATPHPGAKPPPAPPTQADKLLRFPTLPGAEALSPLGVQDLFAATLDRARRAGELPPGTDLALANRLLLSLFFGAAASIPDAAAVADTLSRGLDLIWRGLSEPPDAPPEAAP